MSLLVNSFLLILTLVVVGIGVFLFIKIKFNRFEFKNKPLIFNLSSYRSGGRAFGVEMSEESGKDGRRKITYFPIDVDVEKDEKEIKPEFIICERNKIISAPIGGVSKDRAVKVILPIDVSELPEDFKESELGKMLINYTEIKNVFNNELSAIKEGSSRKTEMLERIGDGEISREFINKMEETMKDMIKNLARNELRDGNRRDITHSGDS